MNYKKQMKIKLMRQALTDFENDFGYKPESFFTNKDNFYFIKDKNKKYIHKKSLQLIYTNYDTYTYDINPTKCDLDKHPKDFQRFNLCKILPSASKHFWIVDWLEGEIITEITEKDFWSLKKKWDKQDFTPFYNQMCYNLIKNNGIYIIDYKHFEYKKDLPFFVYFYNNDYNINTLYYYKDLDKIIKHLEIDYPIKEADFEKFTKK